MKIKFKHKIDRAKTAGYISRVIEAGKGCDSVPYEVSKGDDSEWVVDVSNDLRVQFYGGFELSIWHRYRSPEISYLVGWLAYQLGGAVITDEVVKNAS